MTDTLGLLLAVMVRPADVQDRAGATTLLLGLYLACGCRVVFADAGFAGRLVDWAWDVLGIRVRIVGKPAGQRGFQVHPKRWVVERTLGWLLGCRRLARDYERRPQISEAMIRWAAIGLLDQDRRRNPRQNQTSNNFKHATLGSRCFPWEHSRRSIRGGGLLRPAVLRFVS
jgi:transposase